MQFARATAWCTVEKNRWFLGSGASKGLERRGSPVAIRNTPLQVPELASHPASDLPFPQPALHGPGRWSPAGSPVILTAQHRFRGCHSRPCWAVQCAGAPLIPSPSSHPALTSSEVPSEVFWLPFLLQLYWSWSSLSRVWAERQTHLQEQLQAALRHQETAEVSGYQGAGPRTWRLKALHFGQDWLEGHPVLCLCPHTTFMHEGAVVCCHCLC